MGRLTSETKSGEDSRVWRIIFLAVEDVSLLVTILFLAYTAHALDPGFNPRIWAGLFFFFFFYRNLRTRSTYEKNEKKPHKNLLQKFINL